MMELFNILLYQPLMNFLVFLYQVIPGNDFGIAIIVLTGVIRILLYPLSAKGIRSQKAIMEIQPEIKKIQEKHKNDKEKQVKEMLDVYKRSKINPFSGFLPLLIQLPILIALYRVLLDVQGDQIRNVLYSFISLPEEINFMFLGVIDLAGSGIVQVNNETSFLFGNMIIIIGAGLAQFFQMKMIMKQVSTKKKKEGKINPTTEIMDKMQKQMIYFFPFFTVFILISIPLAIGLYWLVSTLFSIAQQYLILKKTHAMN